MNNFKEAPCSNKLLQKYVSKIFDKAFLLQNVTIQGYPGCGKTAKLKYLCRNITELENYKPTQLFTFLDFDLLQESEDKAFRESVQYLKDYFSHALNTESLEIIDTALKERIFSIANYIETITNLTRTHKYSICFILDSFEKALANTPKSKTLVEIANTIKRTYPL